MGSQTLEIIRQGVWASITGGWFYDPHQNLFCNTIHLYIWLFLLCLPFSIYLYYPPASIGWIIYCSLVAAVFVFFKVLNHSLHHMYDTSECIIIQPPNDGQTTNIQAQRDEGIEMQMLRLGGTTTNASDNESITSLEDQKPNASTIDLKVDVHRKNSSESSVEISATSGKQAESLTATRKSDLCVVQSVDAPGPSKARSHRKPKCSHKKDHRTSKSRRAQTSKCNEPSNSRLSKSALSNVDEGTFPKLSKRYEDSWIISDVKMTEWPPIADTREHPSETFQNKFSRQLSSDSRDNSELSVGPPSPKKKMSHRRRYGNLPDESYTKSAMALATGQSTNMRRNSNSTMSTIQLPLLNSTAQLVSHLRRHSNNADAGFFASVELGAYMLDKIDAPSENTENKPKNKETGVRRIKSAALDVGCPLPNVSNHPNSAETIGALTTKNPNNAVIPPPSTILKRSPPLNLYPRGDSGEGCSYPYLIYGSEIVYPIAEISDEMQTSQKETDPDSTGDSYSDTDDEKFKGFDWNAEQQPVVRSSDSDYENNGSRSPLLDRNNEIKVVRAKSQGDKKVFCLKHPTAKQIESSSDKTKPANVRLKKNQKDTSKNNESTKDIDNIPETGDVAKAKLKSNLVEVLSPSPKDFGVEDTSLESKGKNEKYCKCSKATVVNKPWDHKDFSNSSSSSIESDDRSTREIKKCSNENCVESFNKNVLEHKDSLTVDDVKKEETGSVYSFYWLFDETKNCEVRAVSPTDEIANVASSFDADVDFSQDDDVASTSKNLGAIPKQMKNLPRSRTSSQKENKKKDGKRIKTQEEVLLDAVEAQAALVQGLEYLFAATNANTVVMPNHNREERVRHRQPSVRSDRENIYITRKRSIEEVAQTTTNTLLPTTMPLLAAFLNSRSDFSNIQVCVPDGNPGTLEAVEQRLRPLIDRNHRSRVRKLKRSTRQRNNSIPQNSSETVTTRYHHTIQPISRETANNIHIATSFDDTTDGAIHCFMDECGNWMSYTFDSNNIRKPRNHAADKEEKLKSNKIKPLEKTDSQETAAEGSCGSLESEACNSESISKSKRGDNGDQNSSTQGSNNPLSASGNTLAGSVVPVHNNNSNKRFYVFDGGTGSHVEQHRSPVAYVTDSLLEQIEAERQSRMGLPSMHINFLMSQQRAQQQALTEHVTTNIPSLMPSIGEEDFEQFRSKLTKVLDNIVKSNQPKPKSYYIFKLFKCWELKISMDRLKLLALFDRNHTYWETFVSIMLAILVAVMGSVVLNTGFYRDIYAFWFCFIMAGSQYSLLKSVQPDSASPVHGFNKMVVFSRPVYFCVCTFVLCLIHSYILPQNNMRSKRDQFDFKPLVIYGLEWNEQGFLRMLQDIFATFILFFPLAFSLGFFPQVNTFLMYLLEQIDMHIFGGNATNSLSAALYCVARSLAAIGLLYGFAYSGLVEGKKTQHQKHNVLFSTFCGLLVPIAYHLSRSASDYAHIWNLIKKNLIPPEFYAISAPVIPEEPKKAPPNPITEEKKISSESNIYKQNSIGSSASKINFSSETNISKQKQSQASSTSSLKIDPKGGDSINSNSSLKVDAPSEQGDKGTDAQPNATPLDADKIDIEEDMEDPLPKKLQATVNGRLKNDMIVCTFLALVVFGIHSTTVFTTLRPQLNLALWIIAGILGWLLHYLLPQLRKQQPWLCLAGPVLKSHEHAQFEVTESARLMYYEKLYVYLCFLERNILYPTLVIAATTQDAPTIAAKYGDALGALIVCVCGLKCLRHAYSDTYSQYLIVIFAVLVFQKDFGKQGFSETFLVDYFLTAIIFNKVYEFLLKLQFVVTYIAPWQITWGSAFHAFAQPFSVPHSAMLFLQAAFSALLSSPLTPALGSAIFMTSYVRPVKFWERDYNTKRVDQSNTRLSSQLERNLGADDNNLNSIFYEHLTRSLQHYLCGDLILGRWGQVQQGDCFVLASDYLNCLVHIVEFGNGLVSFQLRGLEFRGTYCQQREVEAISEGPEESNDGVCSGWWCNGRILSPGAMFSLRWLAWQLASAKYVLEGYSVSDNSAVSMLQVFDFRKVLLTYYVKSIIYYTIQSSKLEEWLTSPALIEALKPLSERNYTDLDPIFNVNLDLDYDFRSSGITRSRFCAIYQEWIVHCGQRRGGGWRRKAGSRDSPLVTLCFALSLVGRRALAAAQHLSATTVEFFLYGLHSLFKGDFRITCPRDEWVFTDMSLLHSVLAPAVRMALKLHQDHFMFPEEYCSNSALYSAIASHSSRLVICHEAAPAWRSNVLRGAPHLLALRHVMDEGSDDYKIIMLNKRHLGFRVIKLNRECVRGLWAGQQQELVYLRNRNPERGSIQNAKQALRNIINSSCDQPIGYPIYVSPLTTSYADTSEQLCSLLGGSVTVKAIKTKAIALWRRVRRRCGEGCSSGDVAACEIGAAPPPAPPRHNTLHHSRTSLAGTRGSLASAGKPTSSTFASLAGLLREHSHERNADETVYGSNQDTSEPSRKSEERLSGGSIARRERHMRARNTGKDSLRHGGGRNRLRRERTRPASFRLLAAERLPDNNETAQDERQTTESNWEGRWREQPRRAASAKIAGQRPLTPDSSFEDLTFVPSGVELTLADGRVICTRGARQDMRDFKRFFSSDGTSKDLSKPSKEIRHERESYRELTGRYTEKPDVTPLKETQNETNRETSKRDSKKEKSKELKTKIKHSDSGPSEVKASISIGSKVLIVEPLGVYDCINLGRRIDVQWPSEFQRERGGRNFWGSWVPMAGMDGLVVHKWTPNHRDPKLRSHVDKSILLVQIDDKFVPIGENYVQDLGDEV